MDRPGTLADRTVLVTGAGRGIGRGIALAAAEAGAAVVALDLDGDAARDTAAMLEARGVASIAVACDVTDREGCERALAAAWERMGPVDGLVNNAGTVRLGPAIEADEDGWNSQYRVNLLGTFLMARAFARRLVEAELGGSIVNVASNAGKVGYPNMAGYNATKAGVINLTRSLAAEWAVHGINVNAVCPGGVDTPMLDEVARWIAGRTREDPETLRAGMVPRQLGRHVEPIEVGRVVVFLLSSAAGIIRGQAINTDGGDTPC